MDKEGARLTTYRFTSPSGGVFSYTVENYSEPGGGVEEMEACTAEEAVRDMWKKTSRQQVLLTIMTFLSVGFCALSRHNRCAVIESEGRDDPRNEGTMCDVNSSRTRLMVSS